MPPDTKTSTTIKQSATTGEASVGGVPNTLRTIILDGNDSLSYTENLDIYDEDGFVDANWHHYCVTVEYGVGAKVYIDGSLETSDTNVAGDAINPGTDLYLGGRYDLDEDQYYGGGLDDVRIYGEALDANEVAAIYGE